MNKQELFESFSRRLPYTEVYLDEPMSRHTSFKIGGPADLFVMPRNEVELIEAIMICKETATPFYIIGNGSNLLVRDRGIRGVVIQIYKYMDTVKIEGNLVTAGTGILLSRLAKAVYDVGLAGFEFASGIPGTLGGAIYMNAGAYSGEISQVIESVQVVDLFGHLKALSKDELKLDYRTSILQHENYYAISATLRLEKGDRHKIKENLDELSLQRRTKQPLEFPSAGSTFKRPEGYFAGKLIMDAGLRGYSVGGAQVSEKHCGFVINRGGAKAQDVLDLIDHVQKTVMSQFGVMLETEVKILGE